MLIIVRLKNFNATSLKITKEANVNSILDTLDNLPKIRVVTRNGVTKSVPAVSQEVLILPP